MKLIALLRRLHFPLMLLLSAAPLILLMISHAWAIPAAAAWLFPCACALLCALCLRLAGRFRPVLLALCAALLFALSLTTPYPSLRIMAIAAPLLSLAALPLAGRDIHGVSPFFYVVCIAAHLLTQFLLRLGEDMHAIVNTPVCVLFVLYLILLFLALNRISMDNAALSRYRLPASVRRVNTLLTLAFTALALVLAFSPAIVRGIHAALRALRTAAFALGSWLLSLLVTPEEPGFSGGAPAASLAPEAAAVAPPSQLAIIMEYIASAVAAVVVIAGVLVLVRLLVRLAIRTFDRLVRQLHRFSRAATEDYVDEITNTRGDEGERLSTRLNRRRRAPSYPDTPQGAIRRHYARLLRRHPHWSEGSTARENLSSDPASIYERARYSRHPVTREDADAFARTAQALPHSSPTTDWRKP